MRVNPNNFAAFAHAVLPIPSATFGDCSNTGTTTSGRAMSPGLKAEWATPPAAAIKTASTGT